MSADSRTATGDRGAAAAGEVHDGDPSPTSSEWDEDVEYRFYPEPDLDGGAGHPNELGPTPGADILGLRRASGAPAPSQRAAGRLQVETLIYSLSRSGSGTGANPLPVQLSRPRVGSRRAFARRIAVAAVVAVALVITVLLLLRGPATPPTAPPPTVTSPR